MYPEDADVLNVKHHLYDPFEYLMHRHKAGLVKTEFKQNLGKIAWHVLCHQRVQNIGPKTRDVLALIPGTEINVIERGSNYGWPLSTYGTQYGLDYWPQGLDGRDHGRFVEPVYAFVPSVGITNLIQIGGDQFPRWEGDFLVASLARETLYRMRTREGRVIYLEPILIGRRIRDLAEGSDGRILLWVEGPGVLVLARGSASPA